MKGKGVEYLNHSFQILSAQTYKNFEVIISDHSLNSEIEDLCNSWKDRLDLKHYYNEENRGISSANINNAMSKASGSVIKILFQDDFLYDNTSLEISLTHLLGNHNDWLITACAHTNDGINIHNPFYPKYHDNIQYGNNTISSPSVVMIRSESVLEFDENLFWLMDVEYYKRMYDTFGFPAVCNYISVVNRGHEHQVSHTLATEEVKRKEYEYVVKKYQK